MNFEIIDNNLVISHEFENPVLVRLLIASIAEVIGIPTISEGIEPLNGIITSSNTSIDNNTLYKLKQAALK